MKPNITCTIVGNTIHYNTADKQIAEGNSKYNFILDFVFEMLNITTSKTE